MPRRWQYQAKTEPLPAPVAAAPDLGWLAQQPDVLRTRRRLQSTLPAFVAASAPDVGWLSQQPDILRRRRTPDAGLFVFVKTAYEADDLGWLVEPEPALRRHKRAIFQEGFLAQPYVAPAILDMGWFALPPGPVRKRKTAYLSDFMVEPFAASLVVSGDRRRLLAQVI